MTDIKNNGLVMKISVKNFTFSQVIKRKFGIDDVVCTQLDDPRHKLIAKIRKSCEGHKPQKLTVDSALFLKLFDIRESDRKPLK